MMKRKISPLQTSDAKRKAAVPKLAAKEKKIPIRILRVKKGDDLKTIYAKVRRAFTAADLQKYTEIEEGIPFDQIIAECERVQREWTKKRKNQHKR
jgi:hypothetical protein